MRFLRDAPLQRKITLVTMFTALATLVFALVSLSLLEILQFRRSFERELASIAGVTGGNSVAALEFLDPDSAQRTLGVLREDPRILGAVLYDAEDREFARYRSATAPSAVVPGAGPWFSPTVSVRRPITHLDRRVGSILLVASGGEITDRLMEYGFVAVCIGILSSIAAYLLSRQLREIISRPIVRLAETARNVSKDRDYTLRVEKESNDETGALVDRFNEMLAAIEKASRDLHASETQLRTVTDSLPVLISYVDRERRYQFNNAAYFTWFSMRPEQLKGMPVRDVIGESAFALVEPHYRRAFDGEPVNFEAEITLKDGTLRSFSSSLIPDLSEGHPVRGMFVLIADITERKAAESERERLLSSERAARSEAERASTLKDEFLATLSHELRTPLNAIVGWSQILLRGNRTQEQIVEGLNVIARNARTQAKLISDLLDLSRITSGKLALENAAVRIDHVVRSAWEAVEVSARSKKLTMTCEIDPEVKPVLGDASRLEQVVWNLLSNSVKFTPTDGFVDVTARQSDPNWIEITVTDSGQGIPADFLPYVFERFRQADASTTRKFGGLGIGLSLVRQIVELHGGTVTAASPGEGLGATFTVRLPVYSGFTGFGIEAVSTTPDLSGVRVLVVDDEPDAVGVIRRMLEESRAVVFTAESARRGIELVTEHLPDIVLSDIGMPEFNGYDFIRWVRELGTERGGATPVIALTAFARPEDSAQALAAGFQAHLAKPVGDAELVRTISRVLALE